jgi:hypothetical protein
MPSLRSGMDADLKGSQRSFRKIHEEQLGFINFWPLALSVLCAIADQKPTQLASEHSWAAPVSSLAK